MTGVALVGAVAAALATVGLADLTAVVRRAAPSVAPGASGPALEWLRARIPPAIATERLGARARAAGLPDSITGADVLAAAAACAIAAGLILLPVVAQTRSAAVLVLALIACAAAAAAPELLLRRRAVRRSHRLALELPGVLDLLGVAVGAGQATGVALERVARRHRGLLGSELRRASRAIELGEPRDVALRRLRERCPHEGVTALVVAIERSDRLGAPLADALSEIAVATRAARARAIRDHAARAAPKVQLVVALGLVPATLMLIAAGLLQALQR